MATLDKEIEAQREGVREGYSSFFLLLVIAVTCGVILQSSIQGMLSRCPICDEAYFHEFLLLAISLYILVRSLRAIWPSRLSPKMLGFLVLLGTAFVSALAQAMSIQLIEEFLAPFLLLLSSYSI